MSRTRLLLAMAALGLAAVVLGTGCGGDAVLAGTEAKAIKGFELDSVPAELLGLQVEAEDMSEALDRTERTYLEAVAMYSMRENDLVKATLQVSRFGDDADYESAQFRRTIVNQIGGTKPRTVRLGDESVWLTTGTKQQLAIWFHGRHLFILAVRDDFDRPRSLIRQALEIQP